MENQVDHETEIHTGSSSSSSSPPSSHSSSSSSSSSPSHPQSFASSRSSQKELSVPSSSGSSSSSSSPFSGPASPARTAIDQASSSASEVSHTHDISENAAPFHSGTTTLPISSAGGGSAHEGTAGSSDRQDLLSASEVIEELEDNDGKSANSVCGSTSGQCTLNNDNSQKPPTKSNVSILFNVEGSEVLEACNGPISSLDVIPHDLHVVSASSSDRGCKQNIDQAPSEVNGHIGFNKEHDTISKDDSMQTNEISPSDRPTAETSFITTGPHDDAGVSEAHDSSSTTCNTAQFSQATTPFISPLEPEGPHSSDGVDLGENVSKAAVILSETPSTIFVSEEANKPTHAIKTMTKSSKSFQDASSVNELPRAKTMPSGSLEVVNGEVRPSRPSTFKRSSTDKSKGGGDVHPRTPRTPGPKISKRKQKMLMKKMCTLQKDGTVEVDLERSARFAPDIFEPDEWEDYYATAGNEHDGKAIPPLQIAMLIVGTRGDVQPFVAIGKRLQEHGHRVRLATHSNFQDFVLKAGLEFYPLGGDPKVLAGYMVKNKGFLPSGPSEIRTQKKQLKSIINSLLPACFQPHGSGVPFRAQAIIANPPAYGHVHVAEALQVPLHIFFTMPWTPTNEFPHPLARVRHFAANRLSYQVVDSLIWWGIRGIINDFRKKKLKLRPITYLGGSQQSVSKLPTGYIWSPHLVPKPKDWGPKIDVVGFCFLSLSQDYKPPDQLVKWLAAGPAPIYIGFGSLPVEDPSGMTKIILNALQETSQRGIIDKGWGGIGTMVELPESVYLLDNCPHDWLFSQCAAVVHHGGAGTTAAGLKAACPTTIVPFFGDQAFWGERVHARGVGPPPIPVVQFSLDKLVNAIWFMLDNEVKERAISLAEAMKEEDGVEGAVKAFHRHLPRGMPRAPAHLPKKKPHSGSLSSCIPSCFH